MPDEPEKKEEDPVEAIRKSLNQALKFLQKLMGQEARELETEMEEIESGKKGSQEEGNA